jgi:hypothetical protein
MASNIIEINGKRYDALTGKILPDNPASVTVKTSHRPRVIDGVRKTRHKSVASPALSPVVIKPATPSVSTPVSASAKPATSVKVDIKRAPTNNAKRRRTEHSKTLMRNSVKKPGKGAKLVAKPQLRADVPAKVPAITVTPKLSFFSTATQRLKRAEAIQRSNLISRFGPSGAAYAGFSQTSQTDDRTAVEVHVKSKEPEAFNPVISAGSSSIPVNFRSQVNLSRTPIPVRDAPSVTPKTTQTPAGDIFEQALARATSHEQPPVKISKRTSRAVKNAAKKRKTNPKRRAGIAAGAMSLVLLGGFIAYQNIATVNMQISAARAGVKASLPGYHPAGFSANSFIYSPGMVAVNYKGDNSSYNVTQKRTNWNSEALRDNFVMATNDSYRTVEAAGRTIYIYGNDNASWVDNGIWYEVVSDGVLDNAELIKLASSL